jgi:uncharacterized integral membrane protein
MRHVYFLGGLILGVVIAVFAIQNTMIVEVRFLLWQTKGPLAAAVLISAAAGAVVALLLGIPEVFGARWRIRSLERRLGDLPPKEARRPEENPDEPPRM